MRIPSFAPVSDTDAAELIDQLDLAIERQGWLVVMVHGIGSESIGWEPVPAETYEVLLDRALEQGVWIAPLHEVSAYQREK